MPGDGFNLADYVTVAERRTELRDKYPDAYLRPVDLDAPFTVVTLPDGAVYIAVVTGVYVRDEDGTERGPYGVGMAWEPWPGPTQFTRESELMNAETASWGRAIVANGAADTKRGIASADEVDARRGPRTISDSQRRTLEHEIETRGLPDGCPWPIPDTMAMREASEWIDKARALQRETPPPERRATLRAPEVASGPSDSGDPAPAKDGPGASVPPWRRRPFPEADAPASQVAAWWSVAYAAAPGVAHKRFLDAAQTFARELDRPVPLASGDVTDPLLVATLLDWLDEKVGYVHQAPLPLDGA